MLGRIGGGRAIFLCLYFVGWFSLLHKQSVLNRYDSQYFRGRGKGVDCFTRSCNRWLGNMTWHPTRCVRSGGDSSHEPVDSIIRSNQGRSKHGKDSS